MKSEENKSQKLPKKSVTGRSDVEKSEQSDYNQDLIFDSQQNSYTYDVDDRDDTYDHPLPYESVSRGAVNDDSTFDEANPYIGNEYDPKHSSDDQFKEEYGMHIDEKGKILNTSKADKLLGKTAEDERDDLDEESYPKNTK